MKTKPNILYLHCHDAGRYIQPMGHPVSTPHLQRLAEDGVLFRKAFCAAPTCSPSRACLLTGRNAHSNGMWGLAHSKFNWSLNDYRQHLIHTLHEAGYHSALCGVQHIAQEPDAARTIGYKEAIDRAEPEPEDRPLNATDAGVARAAADWLRQRSPEDGPFFLSVGFFMPHRVYRPADPSNGVDEDARYVRPPPPLPDTPATRRDMADYHASVKSMDSCCGRVLEALQDAGLAEDTLVIATTDHGIAFPHMKCNLTDHGTGVYLILRGPGFRGGLAVDAMVSHLDVFPTVCEALGLKKPSGLDGRSLLPLAREEADSIHDTLFAEVSYHAAYQPMRSARTDRWKYIRRFDCHWPKTVLPNCDASPSKAVWMDHGWADRKWPKEELYDLVFDPNETHNLAHDPAHADVLKDMAGRLDRWMWDTDDPVLKGDLPLGAEHQTHPANAIHVEESEYGRTYVK